MKIVLIAPLPPPVTGNSINVKVLYDEIIQRHKVEVINTNKQSLKSGNSSPRRILDVAGILFKVWRKRNDADILYLSLSESLLGNLKDVMIYLICRKKMKKMVLHLLGGSGIRVMLEKRGWQYRINSHFLKKAGAIIVEGNMQTTIFSPFIPEEKIKVVNNFAEDFLFTSEDQIAEKFSDIDTIRVLFLSNLLYGKGYKELVSAYKLLGSEFREKVRIDFVGGFESERDKMEFLNSIDGHEGLAYLGRVFGVEKKNLYMRSHIFCLPTYYPYEGQPLTILEAYATGCVVITTPHAGIPDIFMNGENGFEVEKRSPSSIRSSLESAVNNRHQLAGMAKHNFRCASEKYRTSRYAGSLTRIIESL